MAENWAPFSQAIVGFPTDNGSNQILACAHAGTAWGSARSGIRTTPVDLSPQLGSFLLNGRYFETIGRGKWPALLRSLPAALVPSADSPLRVRAAMPVKSILKTERPRQAVVEPLLPGAGPNQVVGVTSGERRFCE
jgi:hypothetical protein